MKSKKLHFVCYPEGLMHPVVLAFMLLSVCSNRIVTHSSLVEEQPTYRRNDAKDTVHSVKPFAERRYNEISGAAVTGHLVLTRRTRATKIIGYATVKALRALKALLRKSERLADRNKYTRQYLKDGSFLAAIKDFHSFEPRKISVYTLPKEIKVIEGEAGDIIIRLTAEGGSGLPELDVLKKLKAGDELSPIDKIMYLKD